jgi:hypothetical protein
MVAISAILAVLTATFAVKASAAPSLMQVRQPDPGESIMNTRFNNACDSSQPVTGHNTFLRGEGVGAGTDGGEPGTCFDQGEASFNVIFIDSVHNDAGLDCLCKLPFQSPTVMPITGSIC